VLIVTALPDLYFDEDVRDREARASFEHALDGLASVAPLSLSIAVFSDATSFKTKRREFFQRLCKQADHVVKVESTPDSKLSFTCEKNTPLLLRYSRLDRKDRGAPWGEPSLLLSN
jgi:hypothetical protein